MLNELWKPATLRCVTPTTGNAIGVAFNVGDEIIRVKLPIQDALSVSHLIRDHSEGCSGIPSSEVSSNSPVSG